MSNIHALILLAIGLALLGHVCYEMRKMHIMLNAQKNRRRLWDEENARRHAEIARLLDTARLQQKIEQEKQDVSVLSVPVTAAEREDRRRIVRRLYND